MKRTPFWPLFRMRNRTIFFTGRKLGTNISAGSRIAALAFAVAVLGFWFGSCGDNDGIAVGVVLPLTGSLGPTGRSMKNGLELALEELNGTAALGGNSVRFVFKDDESDPAAAAEDYRELTDSEEVVAVFGPFTSSATEAVIPVINERRVVSIGPSSAKEGLSGMSDYLFRTTLNVGILVPEGVKVTRERMNYENVALIVNEADAFSLSNHRILKEAFDCGRVLIANRECDPVGYIEQTFSRQSNREFSAGALTAQLSAVMNARPAPEALFVSALPPGRVEVMVRARQLGLDVPLVHTLLTADEAATAQDREEGSAEGAISFTNWIRAIDTPENRDFVANYTEKYGEPPNGFAARSYASVYILAAAVSTARTLDSEGIRDALAVIENLETPLGTFSFDDNGDALYDPVVAIIEDGEFRIYQ